MKNADTSRQPHLNDLRRKAEEHLQQVMMSLDEKSVADMQTLVHELHIHQIELTLQNEELLRTQDKLEASRAKYVDLYRMYANLYEFAPVGYCTLDHEGVIHTINLTAAKQLGIERAALRNARLYQYLAEDERDNVFLHLRTAFETGIRQTCEIRLRKHDGAFFWGQLESIVVPASKEAGDCCRTTITGDCCRTTITGDCCLMTITDISARRQLEIRLRTALQEKTLLMKETLHRTKNNMGAIISLLQILAFRYEENPEMLGIFKSIEHRIEAMMLVQRKLYESGKFAHIDLKEYVDELTQAVFYNLRSGEMRLLLETEAIAITPDKAITCGLLLNELLTNALKYAFPQNRAEFSDEPDRQPNEVRVMLQRIDTEIVELEVSDNGVGLPDDFDLKQCKSLGLLLVTGFVQQLQGTFELSGNCGTRWSIRFPAATLCQEEEKGE